MTTLSPKSRATAFLTEGAVAQSQVQGAAGSGGAQAPEATKRALPAGIEPRGLPAGLLEYPQGLARTHAAAKAAEKANLAQRDAAAGWSPGSHFVVYPLESRLVVDGLSRHCGIVRPDGSIEPRCAKLTRAGGSCPGRKASLSDEADFPFCHSSLLSVDTLFTYMAHVGAGGGA